MRDCTSTKFANHVLSDLWHTLGLPSQALDSLSLPGNGCGLPSSYKIGALAQCSIGLSALAAATLHSLRNKCAVPRTSVPLRHAVAEFKSERLYLLNGNRDVDHLGALGGLHQTSDGYVRIHDAFPSHRDGALTLLGLGLDAKRKDVADACLKWKAVDLEREGFSKGAVIAALRSPQEWDRTSQAQAISDFPISVKQLTSTRREMPKLRTRLTPGNDKALQGLRVLELSRVIAAPVAGRTLAAHGADVLWVTSPNLSDLPVIDRDLARGKRTIQLDLKDSGNWEELLQLIKDADIFIQGYRPGSLAASGLSIDQLVELNPNIVIANLSAYGQDGPWSSYRGFDSLLQTCTGMNVSEAEHFGDDSPARPTPCQALDHASGYLLAAGIMTAIYKQATVQSGAYVVDVSLASTAKYLRSLGQYPGLSGFDCKDITTSEQVSDLMESKISGFGELAAVRHSASIEGVDIGFDIMPKPLGSDRAEWLPQF
jgi:hypothetical protein